jgi:hypothetical protein
VNIEEEPPAGPKELVRRKQLYTLMIVALLGAVAAGILLASSVWQWKWDTPGSPPPDSAAAQVDPTTACTLQSTADAIKAELFRRAAQARKGDVGAYKRIADFSLFRIDSPSATQENQQARTVDCSGTGDLELPPEITAAAGGNMIQGPIDFTVQLDSTGKAAGVRVGNADSIVGPLSTIATLAPPEPLTEAASLPADNQPASALSNAGTPVEPPPAAAPEQTPPPDQSEQPQNEQ